MSAEIYIYIQYASVDGLLLDSSQWHRSNWLVCKFVIVRGRNCLPFARAYVHRKILGEVRAGRLFIFYVVLYLCVFFFLRAGSCVPYIASISRKSIVDCHFGFL